MWMSNLYVVVDPRNADRNSLNDIASAISETGATVLAIDEQNHVIEAIAPTDAIATIRQMDGVSYVRGSFSYFKEAAQGAA